MSFFKGDKELPKESLDQMAIDRDIIKRAYVDVMNDPEFFSDKAVEFVDQQKKRFEESFNARLSDKQRQWALALIKKANP